MSTITKFDPKQRYIVLTIYVTGRDGKREDIKAILDTGAPATEFSDEVLQYFGLLDVTKDDVELRSGLQTQKYGRIFLPRIEICSHIVENLEVYVSHFERSWGIKALIGLDFFRLFRVTLDYPKGVIITEPY